ncbi:MAG: rhodanese-like domain-containing protein [Clostridia bacterium]|nr:rhodanese-like domain-containing protein [Clostridia bacterium]
MKKLLFITSILLCLFLISCANESGKTVYDKGEKVMYEQISAEDAKKIMDSCEDCIILDVREQDEYNEGHISDAILIPYTEIDDKAEKMLPDKDKLILVYCRSGRRSKIAAESLVKIGFTNVKEFGGIIDWPYEIEKE